MPESIDKKTTRASRIIDKLSREYPDAACHLNFKNPFQLLISTILAAQCPDVTVNKVMDELYKKYKSPSDFVNAKPSLLENEFKTINFYRNKTKSVQNCSRALLEKHGGKVPRTMEELTSLPGVGRKTANVILGNCFGVSAIMTDTHVIRLSQRLGLTDNNNPDKIEADLVKIIPEEKQTLYSHIIGEHGRNICKAKKPLCPECVINTLCPSNGKV